MPQAAQWWSTLGLVYIRHDAHWVWCKYIGDDAHVLWGVEYIRIGAHGGWGTLGWDMLGGGGYWGLGYIRGG